MNDFVKNTQKLIDDIYDTVDREAVIQTVVGGEGVKAYSSYIAFTCPYCGQFKGFVRKPSANHGGNTIKCSRATCELHTPMSLIDFVAGTRRARGQAFQGALGILAGLIGQDYSVHKSKRYVPFSEKKKKQLQAKIKAKTPVNYNKPKPEIEPVLAGLKKKVHRKVVGYLKSRGIPYELAKEFEVGFAPWKQWPHYGETGEPVRQWIFGRVVFPVRNHKGQLMNLYGRALEDGTKECPKEWRHDFLPGTKGIGNEKDLQKESVHIVEGFFDLLSIKTVRPKANVSAIFGVHGFDWDMVKADNICFCFDPDAAGENWQEIAEEGLKRGKNIYYLGPETYGEYGDLNEVLAKTGTINFKYIRYEKGVFDDYK